MKNQLKNQMILLLLLFGSIMTSFAQSKSGLDGTWELEKVEKFKKENTVYTPVNYLRSSSSNMHAGIYDQLKFQDGKCEALSNGNKSLPTVYKIRENLLDLNFNPLAEVYDWSIENNKLILTRTYSGIDDANQSDLVEYKIILTYEQK